MSPDINAFLFVLVCLSAALPAAERLDRAADIIIVNAKVYTSNDQPAEAIALRSARIIGVGTQEEMERLADANTRRIDAQGCSVTPGFNDSHVHLFSGAESLQQIDLLDAVSLEDIGNRIRSFAAANPNKTIILGRGWLYGFFAGGLPTREQLDALVPDRPAVLKCYDGHSAWLNTRALEAAGITRETLAPVNGLIVRDALGEPTGVLKESAMSLANSIVPNQTDDEIRESLRTAISTAHRLGVTSVQEAGIGARELRILQTLQQAGELELRIYVALQGQPRMTDNDFDQLDVLRAQFKELSIGAVKLYVDGVIEAHTAALLQPYANMPDRGLPEFSQADLERVVAELDRRGYQVMVHAIGDAGIRMTLDAIERAATINSAPTRGRRHRLEHIESISLEDVPRFGQLGVIASMQPLHANPNGNIFNVWAANLGPERAARAWMWKSIQDAGGRLAFGTDWPVVGLDPIPGLHTAMTRQTLDGQPPGGFVPEQRLSLRSALDAYTSSAAYAEFSEQSKGTLATGMIADVVIWDRDIFALPVDEVKNASVAKTIFDGQVVYQREP